MDYPCDIQLWIMLISNIISSHLCNNKNITKIRLNVILITFLFVPFKT